MVQKQSNQKGIKKTKQKIDYLEKKYIAIDPGKSGGIAILNEDNIEAYKCPPTFKEMSDLIKSKIDDSYSCILEKVHAFPTDARSSAFKFGMNYGIWIGILESNNINYELVMPRVWQKDFGLPKNKKERKQELKTIAKGFYQKATLYTADAICMAIWKRANDERK